MGTKLAFAAFVFGLPLVTATAFGDVYRHGFENPVDCSAELSCPQPAAGKACVSGRITDAGSGLPLRAFVNAALQCGAGAIGGACGLDLTAHDAIAFAQNPLTSQPLPSIETIVDGYGRFRFSHLNAPSFGYVAIIAANTDEQWIMSAGSPFGENSFSQVGAILLEFGASGVPRAGVTLMRDGNTVASQDY